MFCKKTVKLIIHCWVQLIWRVIFPPACKLTSKETKKPASKSRYNICLEDVGNIVACKIFTQCCFFCLSNIMLNIVHVSEIDCLCSFVALEYGFKLHYRFFFLSFQEVNKCMHCFSIWVMYINFKIISIIAIIYAKILNPCL